MSIFSGSTEIQSIYAGSTEVQSVYSGSDLVWEKKLLDTTVTSGQSVSNYGYATGAFGSIAADTFGIYTVDQASRSDGISAIIFRLSVPDLAGSPPFASITMADGTVLTPGGASTAGNNSGGTRWLWSYGTGEMSGKTPSAVVPNSGTWNLVIQ